MYLPVRPGWRRVLRPMVTTCVPATLMHQPAVRRLLLHRVVEVVDGAAFDADTRQRRTASTDMARALAAAEQAECARLVGGLRYSADRRQGRAGGVRKKRRDEWPDDRVARLEALWPAKTPLEISRELGVSPGAISSKAKTLGLLGRRAPKSLDSAMSVP